MVGGMRTLWLNNTLDVEYCARNVFTTWHSFEKMVGGIIPSPHLQLLSRVHRLFDFVVVDAH